MKVILVTTSRMGARAQELARLAASVRQSAAEMPGCEVRHYLLLQGVTEPDAVAAWLPEADHWILRPTERLLGLSAARNLILDELAGELPTDAIVAYPDDDAWYPPSGLARITTRFVSDPGLDLWFCDSGPHPSLPEDGVDRRPRLQQLISNATSNTIVVRGPLAAKVGSFDESLGLGTAAVSGEDTDYALRAACLARRTRFCPGQAVGHRARDSRDRATYFTGALLAIARHAPGLKGGYAAVVRKLLVGIILTGAGQLSPAAFLSGSRRALRSLPGASGRVCEIS